MSSVGCDEPMAFSVITALVFSPGCIVLLIRIVEFVMLNQSVRDLFVVKFTLAVKLIHPLLEFSIRRCGSARVSFSVLFRLSSMWAGIVLFVVLTRRIVVLCCSRSQVRVCC